MSADTPRLTTRELARTELARQHAAGTPGALSFECECAGDTVVNDDDLTTYIVLTGTNDQDQCLACGRLYRVVSGDVLTWLPDA